MSGRSIAKQLFDQHLVDGSPASGETVTLAPDQVLLQDTNGPMSFLQFEALGSPRLRVRRVVAYIDHNILQSIPETPTTIVPRNGRGPLRSDPSKAGNGICHQVHLETFSVPGELLVGTDSHTVLCGAVGMLAFGAGSMEVALAMGTGSYWVAAAEESSKFG